MAIEELDIDISFDIYREAVQDRLSMLEIDLLAARATVKQFNVLYQGALQQIVEQMNEIERYKRQFGSLPVPDDIPTTGAPSPDLVE